MKDPLPVGAIDNLSASSRAVELARQALEMTKER